MCDERIRLFYGVVLSEGHKIDVFRVHKQTDVFARRTESIVCGEGQYNGHGDAQGGFYRHRDGCIRYGICNLRSGVSRARRDEHGIGKTLRADRFRFCDGVDNFSSADIFYALVKAFRRVSVVYAVSLITGNISQSFRSRASCARAFSNVQNDPHMAKASVGMSITTPPKYCRPPL